jgi:transcriptional regulator with PAS, ATPase and Fis domain
MNLNIDPSKHPQLRQGFQEQILRQIEEDYEIDKHRIRRVNDWAWYIYPTQHEPTRETVRQAIRLNKEFARYNLLIHGPSGTGKELLAGIVAYDDMSEFIPKYSSINMAGLTDTLFESQLFGYAPGAFTGALAKGAPGFLRSVGKRVAFLDEIGELPLSQQAKLLRVIQEKRVLPVGAVDSIPIGCRFVFATNRNLLAMVQAGTFREDLYFRINQLSLQTYSLQERGPGEIRYLADRIIKDERWTPLEPDEYIPPEDVMLGNVRALYNILLRREIQKLKLPRYESATA